MREYVKFVNLLNEESWTTIFHYNMRDAKANSSSSLHEQSITTLELREDFHGND